MFRNTNFGIYERKVVDFDDYIKSKRRCVIRDDRTHIKKR